MKEDYVNASTPIKRPVWQHNEIIGYVTISLNDRDFLNGIGSNSFYLGFTKSEHEILENGTEEQLIKYGLLKNENEEEAEAEEDYGMEM